MLEQRWLWFAVGSAVCAALVGVFAKVGMEGMSATAGATLRSLIMSVFLVGVAVSTQVSLSVGGMTKRALGAMVLSGVAGALSWLFYFKAVAMAPVSKVAPIDKLSMPLAVLLAVLVLGERPSGWNWVGVGLMVGGAYLAALSKS